MEERGMANLLRPNVEWGLTDEGMSILERAGLAGLHLSLSAADEWAEQGDEQAQELKAILRWELSDSSVRLWWEEKELIVLTKLLEWAWQIRDGVYYMPGMHRGRDIREHTYQRIHTHSGLLGTFLQAGGKPGVPAIDVLKNFTVAFDEADPTKTISMHYRPIKEGENIRQSVTLKNKKICPMRDKKGVFRVISLPGWLYPGAAKRFGSSDENWTGTAGRALLLLFSPIACFYMRLPRTKSKKKLRENWAFLIPELISFGELLERYTHIQAKIQNKLDEGKVLSLGDGALRFAVAYSGKAISKSRYGPRIYVSAMGVTDYYSSNSSVATRIRKSVIQLTPPMTSVNRYARLIKRMPNMFLKCKTKDDSDDDRESNGVTRPTHWVYQPTPRGRIAENLVDGDVWYNDLLLPPRWQIDELEAQRERTADSISNEHLWFKNVQKQWRELMEMVNDDMMWDNPEERMLISIFHATLRRFLDKEEKAMTRGGSRTLYDRWGNRVEKIRRDLMHAKTLILTRKLLTELLAEGGGSKDLTVKRDSIWRLMNHPQDWKKARDLALLALVTFTDGRLGKTD